MATSDAMRQIDNMYGRPDEVGGEVPDNPLDKQLQHFVALERSRRDLDERLMKVRKELAGMNGDLAEQMALAGMQNAKVDGLTVFLRTDKFVSKRIDRTTEQMCAVLRNVGLAYMVSEGYSGASLKSKVKEYAELGKSIPGVLLDALNITEVTKVVARK